MRPDNLILILMTVVLAVIFYALLGVTGAIVGGALVAFAVIGARMERAEL